MIEPTTGGTLTEDGVAGGPVLVLERVTRDFGGLRAVDQVSFRVGPGERLAIIGPNGAGKTTLFKLISREERLTAGRVKLLGRDVTRMSMHAVARLGLGRTYQITRIFPALTVERNVMLAAQGVRPGKFSMFLPDIRNSSAVEKARAAIEHVGLQRVASANAGELGHGQQRQLELALALAGDPSVLLLDEPGAGLASADRRVMRDLVRTLPLEMTMLLIEHDMELALRLADRCICMHNGRVVAEGHPDRIKEDERVQEIYLGKAEA